MCPTAGGSGIGLVVVDLAGTIVDYGSRAPAAAFVALFAQRGVDVSDAEARGPMGMHKREHIRAMLSDPAIAARWRRATGSAAAPADVDALYEEFVPIQLSVLRDHADLVPGALEAIAMVRAMGIRIAATTGYTREMADVVMRECGARGFVPDVAVCGSDVPAGRPSPAMIRTAAMQLGVDPSWRIVKVGDTIVDVEAGRNAGAWSIGVTRSGNMLGVSREQEEAMDPGERVARLAEADCRFRAAGADDVLESVADLPAAVDRINARLAAGERPVSGGARGGWSDGTDRG